MEWTEKHQNESNCNPLICNRTDLLTEAGFMTKEMITEKCKCEKASICKQVVDLLKQGNWQEAEVLITNK